MKRIHSMNIKKTGITLLILLSGYLNAKVSDDMTNVSLNIIPQVTGQLNNDTVASIVKTVSKTAGKEIDTKQLGVKLDDLAKIIARAAKVAKNTEDFLDIVLPETIKYVNDVLLPHLKCSGKSKTACLAELLMDIKNIVIPLVSVLIAKQATPGGPWSDGALLNFTAIVDDIPSTSTIPGQLTLSQASKDKIIKIQESIATFVTKLNTAFKGAEDLAKFFNPPPLKTEGLSPEAIKKEQDKRAVAIKVIQEVEEELKFDE
jgi:hypothetical protein